MITFLKGIIVELSPTHAVLDCNGIGYHLNISLNTFSKFENKKDNSIKFHTYLSVKEDSHTLYGFYDTQERECFILLLSVSGVGASTARMILSSLSPSELQNVIINGDVNALKNVKGIGLKSAQRIIIDLKDKINIENSNNFHNSDNISNSVKYEAASALQKLGFPSKKINTIIEQITRENSDLSVEEVIKIALKTL
ncbi:MAG: Holliday junction branch migration protein RuvA [Flavobacteriales bacterium]|nr:Holliday junction branch migration protein RuvA [Flavobacteriales bacterium]|tara:strand:- start:11060 stop:11650 length:591 start_codon:yes stop_codon:yes gene_type:complete